MLASFRRLSKSTVGTIIMALFLAAIVASFAIGDIQNVLSGGGFSGSSDTLVKIGSEEPTSVIHAPSALWYTFDGAV